MPIRRRTSDGSSTRSFRASRSPWITLFFPVPKSVTADRTVATGTLTPYRTGVYRWTRADPPLANASTSGSRAMVTSPGKVVSSAPWAQPSRRASSGDRPASKP